MITPVENAKQLAEEMSALAKNGYCSCSGLILSLKAGRAPDNLFILKRTEKYILLVEKHARYYELDAVGDFTEVPDIEPLDMSILFADVSGSAPAFPGFFPYRRSVRMDLKLSEVAFIDDREIGFAAKDDISEIMTLLEDSLPDTDIPDETELAEIVDNKCCAVIRKDNKIIAASSANIRGKRCEICHVAVDKKFRRGGNGRKVVNACFRAAAEKGALSAYLWVDLSNVSAVKLYEKLGFIPSKQSTEQFILSVK